jgi:hypothetical protein
VASINGEPLSLDDYLDTLAEMHAEAEEATTVPERDPMALLDRLIRAELILQEARRIGLDELPEHRIPLERFRKDTLRGMLFDREVDRPPPPDPAVVDELLRERFEEFEVALALFADRDQADAFLALLAAPGADFGTVARTLVSDGRAREFQEPRFLPRPRVRPEVAQALALLEPGETSEPIELAGGFGVLRVTATRVPEDTETRAGVERDVLARDRTAAIRAYVERLTAKRARTDDTLVASLDFDASAEEFDTFLGDERVIVRVRGGEPVRVRDLARALKNRMYHGVEQAAQKGRLGRTTGAVLEQLTAERVIEAEARKLRLDTTAEFRARSSEFEDATLFGLFIARIIEPSIEVTDDEIGTYRESHLAEFTEPEMVRVDALTFTETAAAERAKERLDAGADLGWMRENAPGQAARDAHGGEIVFDGRPVLLLSLPASVRDALDGVPVGSYRRYDEAPGRHHVLLLRDRVAPRPRSFEEVRDEVRVRVFAEKREAALADYTTRLREASDVSVFVDRERLLALATGER